MARLWHTTRVPSNTKLGKQPPGDRLKAAANSGVPAASLVSLNSIPVETRVCFSLVSLNSIPVETRVCFEIASCL